MPLYIYNNDISKHIITSESPSKTNIESRILMHLTTLGIALAAESKK